MITSAIENLGKTAIRPIRTLAFPFLSPAQFNEIQTGITTTVLQLETLVSLYKNSVKNINDEKTKVEVLKQLNKYESEIKEFIEKFYSTAELTSDEVATLVDFVKSLKDIDVNVSLDADAFVNTLERFESKTVTDKLKEKISLDVYKYISQIQKNIQSEIVILQEKLKGSYSEELASKLDELLKLQEEVSEVLKNTPRELAYSTELQREIKSLLEKIHQYDLDKIDDRLYSLSNEFETIAPQPEIQENLESVKFGKKLEDWFKNFSGAFSGGGYKEYLKTALTQVAYSIDPRLGAAIDLFGDAVGGAILGKAGGLLKGVGKVGLKLIKSPKLALVGATGFLSSLTTPIKTLGQKLGLLSKSADSALSSVRASSSVATETIFTLNKGTGSILSSVSEKASSTISNLSKSVGSITSSVPEKLQSVVSTVKSAVSDHISQLGGVTSKIKTSVANLVESTKSSLGNVVSKLSDSTSTIVKSVSSKSSEILTSTKSSLSKVVETTKSNLGEVVKSFSSKASEVFKSVTSKLSEVKSTVTNILTKTVSKAKNVLGVTTKTVETASTVAKSSEVISETGALAKVTSKASFFSRALGGVGKVLGKLALPLNIALTGFDMYSDYKNARKQGKSTLGAVADALTSSDTGVSGALKSALKGSSVGAVLGSVIPGLGTVAGTVVGGLAGLVGYGIKSLFGGSKNRPEKTQAQYNVPESLLSNKAKVVQSQATYKSLPEAKLTSTHKVHRERQQKVEQPQQSSQTIVNVNNTAPSNGLSEDYLGLTKLILGY